MPIKLKTGGQNALELKSPIKQLGGGAVDSVNGMTGDVVLEIPRKTSELINDTNFITQSELDLKGYLTEHQDVSALATKSEVAEIESKIPNLEGYATERWVEGKGYLTEHQSLENYATRSEIPTKTSELTNDSGYLTEHQSLAAYSTTTEVQSMINTAIGSITDGNEVSY